MSRARELADAGSKANFLDNVTEDLNTALASVEGTEIKSTGETGGSKFLREDGDDSCSWQTVIAVPTGAIFSMAFTPDSTWLSTNGYLICDGSAVSRTTYSSLFSTISTTWGSGDGSSTFNIPDLKNAHLRGVGTSTVFTQDATTTLGQTINDQFQGHGHKIGTYAGSATYRVSRRADNGPTFSILNEVREPITFGSYGTVRTGTETRVNARGVQFIIKF